MTDRASGLRFDIYERVHLPDDVAAIEELEEIELVPHMQALNQADQLLLKGHLLLTGVYRSSERRHESAKLEHWIPVEISLPPSRVQRVEDLAVEIDNFDVDLLSTRSLNVTGVLALRGLQADTPQPPVWRDDSFTVVHQAQTEAAQSEADSVEAYFAESQPNDRLEQTAEPNEAALTDAEAEDPDQLAYLTDIQQPQADGNLQWPADDVWGDLTERNPDAASNELSLPGNAPAKESKPEVKIALGVKSADDQRLQPAGVELLSMLGDKRSDARSEAQAISAAELAHGGADPKAPPASTGDELEWKRLFVSAETDAEPFCKVRMCIVQREDTLEGIAARYNVQTRELQMRNRLSDLYLSEGQVLYIP